MRYFGAPASCASTGPRSEERGDESTQPLPTQCGVASTGPRSEERGDRGRRPPNLAPISCFNGAALRRARRYLAGMADRGESLPGFNGAALRRARRCDGFFQGERNGHALQRGRAPKSAEIGGTTVFAHTNGTLQRGRAPKSAEIFRCLLRHRQGPMLQRGRAPKSAEMLTCMRR